MTADEYRKLDAAFTTGALRELHTDRGTWGLTLFFICVTFWLIIFGLVREYF